MRYGLGWHGGHGGHGGHHGRGLPDFRSGWDYPTYEVVNVQSCPSLYVWDDASQACKLDLLSPPLLIAGGALLLAVVALLKR